MSNNEIRQCILDTAVRIYVERNESARKSIDYTASRIHGYPARCGRISEPFELFIRRFYDYFLGDDNALTTSEITAVSDFYRNTPCKYATNLSIITNGTRADSDNIIADLSEKSFEFKVDISELESAYETLLRTGKAAGELDDYLKSTVFLSKIGFEDMETSASNLVTIGNAFKLQSDEIENVVSSLVALDTASNTVAGKLSTAMGKTAQNAQLAGLSIDELGAIISGLRDTTGKTEDAIATSLNSMLTRLYNVKLGKYEIELEDGSTEDITESLNNVERMLKTVGMDIRTSKGEFKDVTDIIGELVDKWGQLNDVQKNAVGFTFAGTHHKNTFIALIENWDRI